MTESLTRIGRSFAVVLLLAASMRIVIAIAAGVAAWAAENDDLGFPNGTARTGDVLINFGGAGDGVGVLLVVAAGVLVAWLLVSREPAEQLRTTVGLVLALTAISAFVQALGQTLLFAFASESIVWSRLFFGAGDSLVYAGVALGALAATRRLDALTVAHSAERFGDDPLVFAVDRQSGEVHAYLSVDAAERKSHVFSVEDDELAFYTDEGKVVGASVEHDRVVLTPTDVDQRDVLLDRLREFVVRRGIHVHPQDDDNPVAYARPISDWQWLQLWPGWLRWMGRMFRPR